MNNGLFFAAVVALLLSAVSASAQGLPFSSDANSNRPWSINQQPYRDLNVYSTSTTPSPNAGTGARQADGPTKG